MQSSKNLRDVAKNGFKPKLPDIIASIADGGHANNKTMTTFRFHDILSIFHTDINMKAKGLSLMILHANLDC